MDEIEIRQQSQHINDIQQCAAAHASNTSLDTFFNWTGSYARNNKICMHCNGSTDVK